MAVLDLSEPGRRISAGIDLSGLIFLPVIIQILSAPFLLFYNTLVSFEELRNLKNPDRKNLKANLKSIPTSKTLDSLSQILLILNSFLFLCCLLFVFLFLVDQFHYFFFPPRRV